MKRIACSLSMLAAVASIVSPARPAQGAEMNKRWALGLQGGTYKLVLTDHSDAWTLGWVINGDLKYSLTPHLAIGAEGSWMRTYIADLSGDSELKDGAGFTFDNLSGGPRQHAYAAGLIAEYRLLENRTWSPYIVAGPGIYIWKWTDKNGNTLSSDDPALDDPDRIGLRVPEFDRAGHPYDLKDQELYAMVGAGVECYPYESVSFELGGKFRFLTHLLTDFTDDQDIVGSDPGELDLPRGVLEAYAGLTFHFGGPKCPPLTSAASVSPTTGAAPLTVELDASVAGGCPEYAYDWDFGDGDYGAGRKALHTYASAGSYVASLIVTDAEKTISQSSVSITVECPELVAKATGIPTEGPAPLTVKFEGSASGGCGEIAYSWDFGDGATSDRLSASHIYRTGGTYAAVLAVTDSKGVSRRETVTVTAAEEFLPTPEKPVILRGVNFEYNKAVLAGESAEILDRVAASLLNHPGLNIEVGGHCDSDGNDAYNQKLSERRAQTVRDYLVAKGVPAAQLTAKGYGESEPIADNTTPEGKAANRRVELKAK